MCKIIARTSCKIDTLSNPEKERSFLVKRLIEVLTKLTPSRIERNKIIGVGIGVAGLVDVKSATILYSSSHPGWNGFSLKNMIEAKFSLPLFVDNEVKARTLGEKEFGEGKGIDNFVYVNVAEGINSRIIISNSLGSGSNRGSTSL